MFSLDYKEIYPLIKGREATALLCGSGYGPIFGGGNDLYLSNDMRLEVNNHVKMNDTYRIPNGRNKETMLTGASHFAVQEMEVYKVI